MNTNSSQTKILIADDDRDLADSIGDILRIEGFDVRIAYNSKDTKAHLEEFDARICLLDNHFGSISGIGLMPDLLSIRPQMSCIIMTGDASWDSAVSALSQGAYSYLSKPLHKGDLLAMLNQCLEASQWKEDAERAQEALNKSEERYRVLVENSPDLIGIANDGKWSFINAGGLSMLGASTDEEIIGKSIMDFVDQDDDSSQWLSGVIEAPDTRNDELVFRTMHGDQQYTELRTTPISLTGDNSMMLVARDISDQKKAAAEIEKLTYLDQVTGLPNRRLLLDRMSVELSRESKTPMALLTIKLNNLSVISQMLSNKNDALFKEVAERIRFCLDKKITVARIEEGCFSVLITDATESVQTADLALAIIDALTKTPVYRNQYQLDCSVGISRFPQDAMDKEALVRTSRMAANTARSEGKNLYHFYTPEMDLRLQELVRLELLLRKAIDEGGKEFKLVYQPKVDLTNGKMVGLEALIRWNQPKLGLIPPDKFIPLAEATGLIGRIGDWVLKEAFHQLKRWLDEAGEENMPMMSINISGHQLTEKTLLAKIFAMIDETEVDPKFIELELTETSLIERPKESAELLVKLKERGLNIALDDFGTGYSSLFYLKHFPFDTVKIDRGFVSSLPGDREDMAITDAIIHMAHSLNMSVVAEGVETEDQETFLKGRGCEQGQGYYFGRPVDQQEIIDKLMEGKSK